jgi:hypothetical protein
MCLLKSGCGRRSGLESQFKGKYPTVPAAGGPAVIRRTESSGVLSTGFTAAVHVEPADHPTPVINAATLIDSEGERAGDGRVWDFSRARPPFRS